MTKYSDNNNYNDDVDEDNESEGRSITFRRFHSLLKTLGACFNFFFFGIPSDYDKPLTRHSCADPIIEQMQLWEARCELMRKSSDTVATDTSKGRNRTYDQILHCQQDDVWDCGLTCILMLIRFLKQLEEENNTGLRVNTSSSSRLVYSEKRQKQWMLDKLQTQSIWTIDLVMLLESIFNDAPPRLKFPKRHLLNGSNVKYLYCSNYLGVDETYKGLTYYRNAFGKDEKRVSKLFSIARNNSIPMLNISEICIDFVVDIVSKRNCLAIVLLDYSILGNKNAHFEDDMKGNTESTSTEFSGHYVILSGISTNENDIAEAKKFGQVKDSSYCMVISNPGCADDCTFVGKEIFEKAWRAKGTDSDIIFFTVR
jgi:hypothetical protein